MLIAGLVLAGALASAWPTSAQADDHVTHPIWTRRPTAEDLRRLYPVRAYGVTGYVSADCLIDERGEFTTCEIVHETPKGLGFGESTIGLSKIFRMKPVDADGAPVAGRKLTLPVRWSTGFSR